MTKGLKGFQKGCPPWNKGLTNIYSEKTKIEMGFWKGKKMSDETKDKMSKSRTGSVRTDETKEKMRIAQKKRRNPNVEKECGVCQKIFEVVYSRRERSKYCSKKCQFLAYKGREPSNKGIYKGEKYGSYHYKVRKIRGTPSKCEVCETDESKIFEWANLTGRFEDINDYKRMCRSCHSRYDKKINNINKKNQQ